MFEGGEAGGEFLDPGGEGLVFGFEELNLFDEGSDGVVRQRRGCAAVGSCGLGVMGGSRAVGRGRVVGFGVVGD